MTKCDRTITRLRAGWNELAVRDGILETGLPSTAKLLLLGLVTHQDGTTRRRAQVGLRRLAQLATTHKDTAAGWLRRLAAEGWIVLTPAPRNRTPEVFLAGLPGAIVDRLVSEAEGHAVSYTKGHRSNLPCPSRRDTSVLTGGTPDGASVSGRCPDLRSSVSGSEGLGVLTEGSEGNKKGPIEGTNSAHADASAPTAPLTSRGKGKEARRRGSGDGKPKASARKPKPKPTKPTTPGHAEVMAHYAEAFERRRGTKPILGGAEGTAIKTLLGKLNGDVTRARAIIDNALGSWCGDTVTILVIARDPSRFAAPAPAKPNGRRAPEPQPAAAAGGWKPPVWKGPEA